MMTSQQYLEGLLDKYNLTDGQITNLKHERQYVQGVLESYFQGAIETVYYSGSYAKGTAVNLSSDLDICLYFRKTSFASLEQMFYMVSEALDEAEMDWEPQTVSIHANMGGSDVDIVPARSLGDGTGNAELYVTPTRGSLLTNIPKQLEYMSTHRARPIIKLMKVWRFQHKIHFKSFALELLVIKALENVAAGSDFGTQMMGALEYARDHAADARLVDPGNPSNIVSELISLEDKQNLARQAGASRAKKTWEEIVW